MFKQLSSPKSSINSQVHTFTVNIAKDTAFFD